jgi:putative transposase
MKKQHVHLSEADRTALEALVSKGKQTARAYQRALGLLELDRGKTMTAVAETLGVTQDTVRAWRDKYREVGLGCLKDAPRSGRPVEISGEQRAKITALACSEAPPGHARWDLRLLADKIVELGYCEHISHTHVGNILKKTNFSPT